MKHYGSIWRLAISHILATTPDSTGELYVGSGGELDIVPEAKDAPEGSRFVAMMKGEATSIPHVAARLAQVATGKD